MNMNEINEKVQNDDKAPAGDGCTSLLMQIIQIHKFYTSIQARHMVSLLLYRLYTT